ncbi:Low affinity Fe/Cu permease [Pedobacter steynii]|uniref:Low affinity Fe/Cu permease n=1 Tax=Pedobacter steynii TaxID=430522 RepID=A0A1G9J9Z6_9SPHI|nr:low affinity iron permease family protein [Pedobacter steynii]NQX38181.1 low affinity iron permease family protein [Pedobacter steynii]SDL34026.1 Low affinity Fe/Cu permease [Pedobacter steynii]
MKKNAENFFEKISTKITNWTGSPVAFGVAFFVVMAWVLSGPIFNYSDTWQLVINTGTTIITFLMVFLIQKSQNKDSKAIQLKLNELIAASRHASNRMVDIEDLTESELDVLHKYYQKISDISEADEDIHKSHSIDAAKDLQEQKSGRSTIAKTRKPGSGAGRTGSKTEKPLPKTRKP